MKKLFNIARHTGLDINPVETIDLPLAQSYAENARNLGLAKLCDHVEDVFPQDISEQDIMVVGAGPSLDQAGETGQSLLEEMDARPGFKILASMATRLLNHTENPMDCVVLGSFNSERINALKQGGPELIEKLKDIKILAPTYVQPEVFDYLIGNGLKDNIYLWEPQLDGLKGAEQAALFPGSTGANAATSIVCGLAHSAFQDKEISIDYYGVDTSNPGQKISYAQCVANLVDTQARLEDTVVIVAGDQTFTASKGFWEQQTVEFESMVRASDVTISPQFHGNTVNAAMFKPEGISPYKLNNPQDDIKNTLS